MPKLSISPVPVATSTGALKEKRGKRWRRARKCTHPLGPWALRLTYLQNYFTIRTVTHYLSSFPRKTCCPRSFLFSFHCFFSLNLFLYGILEPSAERFALLNGLKTCLSYNAHLHLETLWFPCLVIRTILLLRTINCQPLGKSAIQRCWQRHRECHILFYNTSDGREQQQSLTEYTGW